MDPEKNSESTEEQDLTVEDEQRETEAEHEAAEEAERPDAETLQRALDDAEKRCQEYREEAIRAAAEADNVRKRSAREVEQARKFALERFMGDLLDVSDSLERGLEAAESEQATVQQLREGKTLTLRQLKAVLEKHGLRELDPKGEKFNPEHHEAMSMVPTSEVEPDTVVEVFQKGYLLNDRLLRPARVLVAKAES